MDVAQYGRFQDWNRPFFFVPAQAPGRAEAQADFLTSAWKSSQSACVTLPGVNL